MKRTAKSLGFALSGLAHAVKEERNVQLFLLANVVVVLAIIALRIHPSVMVLLVPCAGLFLMVELFNTAIERIADTIDDCEKKRNAGHYHPGIKQAKDVASAASLIALTFYVFVLILIFSPAVLPLMSITD